RAASADVVSGDAHGCLPVLYRRGAPEETREVWEYGSMGVWVWDDRPRTTDDLILPHFGCGERSGRCRRPYTHTPILPMRAMCLPSPAPVDTNPLELVELPAPEPGPGEALIRVEVCG